MENASKALLIAGAILIVILLIAVGMLVYSQSRGVIDTGVAQTESMDLQMFLNQFTIYEGKNKDKSTVKFAIQSVINNNQSNKENSSRLVGIIYCYKSGVGLTYTYSGADHASYDRIKGVGEKILSMIEEEGYESYEIIFRNKEDTVNDGRFETEYLLFIIPKGLETYKETFGI